MRRRFFNAILIASFFCACIFFLSHHYDNGLLFTKEEEISYSSFPENEEQNSVSIVVAAGPEAPQGPAGTQRAKAVLEPSLHPISYLVNDARKELENVKKRQSTSLEAAVGEYRRRYGMPPPPHFDKWYEFAVSNGVQLIDEFDTIHDLMMPFWGLKAKTIRSRVKEALGFENKLIGIAIRDHKVALMENGLEWQRNATKGMIDNFVAFLPDMDLAFNMLDEPRVMIPHDDLGRLMDKARREIDALNAHTKLVNEFSARGSELTNGGSFEETKHTRFNVLNQQATWTHSRMSCSPDSPARNLEDDKGVDDVTKYGLSDLGFVFNSTAMSDVCLTPSLRSSYGLFDRSNRYSVVHDLLPIFSQSKISSYSDILYPSPWYWQEKVKYNVSEDMPWNTKNSSLYWRGSTTGGYSRNGGWRHHHRQHVVQRFDSKDLAKIMVNSHGTPSKSAEWKTKDVPRGDYRHLIDVHFSHVGQCDPGDCAAQAEFFQIADFAEQQNAWGYKYLLDMDGNAFSGRFYAFLRSRSLTFKLALSREWHDEWLRPWVHFVPMSLKGDEWLEAVRFFNESQPVKGGKGEDEKIAEDSRAWANKALRKEDMEAWFFRLLLEYARVIDDNRANLGFDLK